MSSSCHWRESSQGGIHIAVSQSVIYTHICADGAVMRVICAVTATCTVCSFIGMTAVIHGGMMKWQRRRQNVNQSGLTLKIPSSCFIQGSYDIGTSFMSYNMY